MNEYHSFNDIRGRFEVRCVTLIKYRIIIWENISMYFFEILSFSKAIKDCFVGEIWEHFGFIHYICFLSVRQYPRNISPKFSSIYLLSFLHKFIRNVSPDFSCVDD